MKKLKVYIPLIILIISFACDKNAFLDSGPTITKTVEYDFYNHIVLNDIFDVYLQQDTVNKLVMEGGENVLDQLSINLNDTVLSIDNDAVSRWIRSYDKIKLTFHFTNIRKMELHEPCYIESLNEITSKNFSVWALAESSDIYIKLNTDNFFLVNNSTSTGLYNLSGTSRYFRTWTRGSAILDADSLQCESLNLHFSSIANAYINVTRELNVTIDGKGTVYYIGDPETINRKNEFRNEQLIKLD